VTRLVIDASTLLSAIVARTDGPLAALLGAVNTGAIEMVVCEQLVGEVSRGLRSSYFRDRVSPEARLALEAMLASVALHFPDPVSPPSVLRDPGDDYLVALARDADASAIVSGDRDLLDHDGLQPQAISARQACDMLGLAAS
jgi:putative PIN family toxin of toxin-antitoxin system